MVSATTPDEPGEATPVRLSDLPQSELVELVKVHDVFMDFACFSTLTPLQNLQLETSKLQAELRTLNTTRVVSTSTEEPVDPLSEHRTTFLELGKKFCILSELWVDGSALGCPYPATIKDSGPWSHDRYETTASVRDGVTAEIYACVPQAFHKLINISPFFSSTVGGFVITSPPLLIISLPPVPRRPWRHARIHDRHDPQERRPDLRHHRAIRFGVQNFARPINGSRVCRSAQEPQRPKGHIC